MTATFQTLCALDERLNAAGHHALTPWWREQLQRFYEHPTARTFVGQVGRGGAKSHTSAKVGLNETLFGDWVTPPGERHYWLFLSENKAEAAQRLRLIESFLDALAVPYARAGDEIALTAVPRGFIVRAAVIGRVSGFRCYGYSADELAKWRAEQSLANPAAEVCASANAMCVTHPGARRLKISSPLSNMDHHYDEFERGDTTDQVVANAPSWVANPEGITEQQTRELEPDERTWRREYLAQPQASVSAAFPDSYEKAFRSIRIAQRAQPVGIVDASSGGGDEFSYGVVSYCRPEVLGVPRHLLRQVPKTVVTARGGQMVYLESETEFTCEVVTDQNGHPVPNPAYREATRPVAVFRKIDGFEGRFKGTISGSEIVERIAKLFKGWGISTVLGDQREAFFLGSEFMRHGLQFREIAWTNENKREAVTRLKRLFAEESIVLPDRPKLRRELASYTERITPSGSITYSARGTGHDDEVSLLLTFAMGELERLIPGSPLHFAPGRHEVPGR